MKLKDCTKEELLFIIDRLKQHLNANGDFCLALALDDVEFRRETVKLAEAGELAAYADQKRKEYFSLLQPYEGKPIGEVPLIVLAEARKAIRQAQEADSKWAKLMGIKSSMEEST